MPVLHIEKERVRVTVAPNALLMDELRARANNFETPCNGCGTCGKCAVRVQKQRDGAWEEVLACQYLIQEDITVRTDDAASPLISLNEGVAIELAADSDTVMVPLSAGAPLSQIPLINGVANKNTTLTALKKIAKHEREKNTSGLYAILYGDCLIDIAQGEESRLLGLSIDLGTTGVSVLLIDAQTGETLCRNSFLNPQYAIGGDVLTRVSHCMRDERNLAELQRLVIDKLNETLLFFEEAGYRREHIYRVVVAGNSIMQHIFAGINPAALAKNPYRPIFDGALDFTLPALAANESAVVTLLPSISSYIGGDVVGGVLSSGFYDEKRNALFIDIGTNGEIVLKLDDEYWGTSTAAGPALEGMNISCGQRAVSGAIERFYLDDAGGIAFATIENAPPTGICGSGLIDLVAVLLEKGFINAKGNLQNKAYAIHDGITLTQKDVRQIQLAKAAIATGVKMLLRAAGGGYEDIGAIYIAGSFGYHLNAESLKRIAFIDPSFGGKIIFTGNSSLEGARLALINRSVMGKLDEIRRRVKPLELSHHDDFQSFFVRELSF